MIFFLNAPGQGAIAVEHSVNNHKAEEIVKKIKKASDNGKDEKAIEIINQIFLDEK